jgi:hypothetical protein
MEIIINLSSKMGSKHMVKHLKSKRNNVIHILFKKGQFDLNKVKLVCPTIFLKTQRFKLNYQVCIKQGTCITQGQVMDS